MRWYQLWHQRFFTEWVYLSHIATYRGADQKFLFINNRISQKTPLFMLHNR